MSRLVVVVTVCIYIWHLSSVRSGCRYVEYDNFIHPIDQCAIIDETTSSSIKFICTVHARDDGSSVYAPEMRYYANTECSGGYVTTDIPVDNINFNCDFSVLDGGSISECLIATFSTGPCEWLPALHSVAYTLVGDQCPYNGYKFNCENIETAGNTFSGCGDPSITNWTIIDDEYGTLKRGGYLDGNFTDRPIETLCGYGFNSCHHVAIETEQVSNNTVIIILAVAIPLLLCCAVISIYFYCRKTRANSAKDATENKPDSDGNEVENVGDNAHGGVISEPDGTPGPSVPLMATEDDDNDVAPAPFGTEHGDVISDPDGLHAASAPRMATEDDENDVAAAAFGTEQVEMKGEPEGTGEAEPGAPLIEERGFDEFEVRDFFYNKVRLGNHEHMDKYIALFIQNGYDTLAIIQTVTEQDLIDIGVDLMGHRKKILVEIQQ